MASSLRYIDRSKATDRMPDRLNEMWRAGRPHVYAKTLAQRLQTEQSQGRISCDAPQDCQGSLTEDDKAAYAGMLTNGSRALIEEQLKHPAQGCKLHIEQVLTAPIHIKYESSGLFTPLTSIHLAAGAKAHIIEEHEGQGTSILFCLRRITLEEGAELTIELREQGSEQSWCMNISDIVINKASLTHFTEHSKHAWAREETGVRLAQAGQDPADCKVQLLSANLLQGKQVLDQRTNQDHMTGYTASDLLYKNVIDDQATAIFDGNIMVAQDAHHSDAYLNNFNLMLSEDATIQSMPGLEILADKVRCSHGSASGPLNEEELFYLCARGIPKYQAQQLVAAGFLEDVRSLLPQS